MPPNIAPSAEKGLGSMPTSSRKECCSAGGQKCDLRNLGDSLYHVVHHSELSARELAEQLGVRPGYLLDAANPDRDDTQFQLRLLAPLTRLSKNDALIEAVARGCGGVFVRTPTLTGRHADIAHQSTRVLREVCEAIEAPAAAVENDARIDAAECAGIDKQIDEAIAALLVLKTVVRAAADLPPASGSGPVRRRA